MIKGPCGTCAFRKGCETAGEPDNVLKAEICAAAGLPFFCHHETNMHLLERQPMRDELRANGICRGWQVEVRKRNAAGFFKTHRIYRKAIGRAAILLLDMFIAAKSKREKKSILTKLRDALFILKRPDLRPEISRARIQKVNEYLSPW
jgi:hypothetical protein